MNKFEPVYLGNYQYWWQNTHYRPHFLRLHSFTPLWVLFLFLFSFLCFYFFFSSAVFFRSQRTKSLNFYRLYKSRRTVIHLKLEVPSLGSFPNELSVEAVAWLRQVKYMDQRYKNHNKILGMSQTGLPFKIQKLVTVWAGQMKFSGLVIWKQNLANLKYFSAGPLKWVLQNFKRSSYT